MKIETTLGPDFETHPTDPQALAQALAQAQRDLALARDLVQRAHNPDAPGILGRELVHTAKLSLLAADWEQTQALLEEVIALWQSMDRQRAAWLARLELATLWRRRQPSTSDHLQRALTLLDALVLETDVDDLAMYRDFALHARGLTLWRAGALDLARRDLTDALQLRQRRPNSTLARQTQALLDALSAD